MESGAAGFERRRACYAFILDGLLRKWACGSCRGSAARAVLSQICRNSGWRSSNLLTLCWRTSPSHNSESAPAGDARSVACGHLEDGASISRARREGLIGGGRRPPACHGNMDGIRPQQRSPPLSNDNGSVGSEWPLIDSDSVEQGGHGLSPAPASCGGASITQRFHIR